MGLLLSILVIVFIQVLCWFAFLIGGGNSTDTSAFKNKKEAEKYFYYKKEAEKYFYYCLIPILPIILIVKRELKKLK